MLQRGFTLIELLVVIAIIGILAAVVLTSLGGAQSGAIDSNIQQSLGGLPSEAQLFYNQNSFSYAGVCDAVIEGTDGVFERIAGGAGQLDAATMGGCEDSATAWAASFELQSDGTGHWCVDSDGARREIADALPTDTTSCPAS